MNPACPYIFVYGTLLMNGNKYAGYLQQHCRLIGEGAIKGLVYDIGEYPGAVIDINSLENIHGTVYFMDQADLVLQVIDEYEGLAPNEPIPHEYVRRVVDVKTEQGIIPCWVYLYNWPVNGFATVAGGKYLDYINRKI